jgi:hypothetical protein
VYWEFLIVLEPVVHVLLGNGITSPLPFHSCTPDPHGIADVLGRGRPVAAERFPDRDQPLLYQVVVLAHDTQIDVSMGKVFDQLPVRRYLV